MYTDLVYFFGFENQAIILQTFPLLYFILFLLLILFFNNILVKMSKNLYFCWKVAYFDSSWLSEKINIFFNKILAICILLTISIIYFNSISCFPLLTSKSSGLVSRYIAILCFDWRYSHNVSAIGLKLGWT